MTALVLIRGLIRSHSGPEDQGHILDDLAGLIYKHVTPVTNLPSLDQLLENGSQHACLCRVVWFLTEEWTE